MSGIPAGPRRRADAVRSRDAVLAACLALLDRGEDPSLGRVAAEAGVTRQTIYAHFASRDELLRTAVAVLGAEVSAALASTEPRAGTLGEAVDRWCAAVWRVLERRPALLNPALAGVRADEDVLDVHEVVIGELRVLARRARRERELPRQVTVDWLVRAVIALGHAAGDEVATGRMTSAAAGAAFRLGARGVLLGDGCVGGAA
jgi:AcrR family transcriptional regulator